MMSKSPHPFQTSLQTPPLPSVQVLYCAIVESFLMTPAALGSVVKSKVWEVVALPIAGRCQSATWSEFSDRMSLVGQS